MLNILSGDQWLRLRINNRNNAIDFEHTDDRRALLVAQIQGIAPACTLIRENGGE